MVHSAGTVGAVGSLVHAAAASTAHHSNTAFVVVFGIFVAALVVLVVVVMLWAIRRDKSAFAEWRRRRAERAFGTPAPGGPGAANGNGRTPGAPAPGGQP